MDGPGKPFNEAWGSALRTFQPLQPRVQESEAPRGALSSGKLRAEGGYAPGLLV